MDPVPVRPSGAGGAIRESMRNDVNKFHSIPTPNWKSYDEMNGILKILTVTVSNGKTAPGNNSNTGGGKSWQRHTSPTDIHKILLSHLVIRSYYYY